MSTPHEELARLHKAMALADVFDALGFNHELVRSADEDQWRMAARVADVNLPSEHTRLSVALLLKERLAIRDRVMRLKLALAQR